MKHKHHIIPKHMGGNDSSHNIIELTIEEHAEAHKQLYEQHGHWQDYIAWKGLLGLITSDECTFIAMSEGGKKGAKIANIKRWGSKCISRDDPNYIPHHKRKSGYDVDVDGRRIRLKRFWFNNGIQEGQYSLTEYPEGWQRGRLKSILQKMNKFIK